MIESKVRLHAQLAKTKSGTVLNLNSLTPKGTGSRVVEMSGTARYYKSKSNPKLRSNRRYKVELACRILGLSSEVIVPDKPTSVRARSTQLYEKEVSPKKAASAKKAVSAKKASPKKKAMSPKKASPKRRMSAKKASPKKKAMSPKRRVSKKL